jgi:hypothetical protein
LAMLIDHLGADAVLRLSDLQPFLILRRTVAYAVVQTMNSAFDINLDATEERQSAKLVAFRKTVASSGIHSFSDELAAALGTSLSSS